MSLRSEIYIKNIKVKTMIHTVFETKFKWNSYILKIISEWKWNWPNKVQNGSKIQITHKWEKKRPLYWGE